LAIKTSNTDFQSAARSDWRFVTSFLRNAELNGTYPQVLALVSGY
jgi:hypothetical protein